MKDYYLEEKKEKYNKGSHTKQDGKNGKDEVVSEGQKLFGNLIWMTVGDTARYLSRTENAIRILICRGVLKTYRLGRRVYLKRSDIDGLMESSILNGGY